MTDEQLHHLIRMVNQISANNLHHGDEGEAAHVVADHLKKFWARSMKAQIIAYARDDGAELSPVSRLAIRQLAEAAAGASVSGG